MNYSHQNEGRGGTHIRQYVIFDVETTGLQPQRGDRVIEIGAVAIEDMRILGEFHSLVNVNKRIPSAVRQIHGITNDMLIDKPKPENVFPRFYEFIGNKVLVAHNAQFDMRFLRYEFGRLGLALNNRYLCTLEMSRKRYPKLRNHRLETVFRHLFGKQIENVQMHRALSDARMTARVWLEMMKREANH